MKGHFATFLADQIAKQRTTARGLAAKMGIHESAMSGYLNGKRVSCELATLGKMCRGISNRAEIRRALLIAALRDNSMDFVRDAQLRSLKRALSPLAEKLASPRLDPRDAKLIEALIDRLSVRRNNKKA